MKVLLKQATVIDPTSSYHLSRKDILIADGFIRNIADNISIEADKIIGADGLHVSPGWVDIFADFCDPGYENRESLESGSKAAAAGGFTTVMVIPNTRPVIDNKSQVEYIIQKSKSYPVNIIPIGAITKNAEGKELAEMYDMHNSGALAFSDGINPVQSSGMLVKALLYVKSFDGVIIQVPDDKSIVPHGLMNEGVVSTRLGLAGKPVLSEEIIVARDIKLARYTDSKLHFTGVTSPKSLEYIRRAKEGGIGVSCSVTPYHLFFCDEDLADYDTNLKVNPPLRTRKDMLALREAVAQGVIDCITTHHSPHDFDSKVVEFEYARNGMIGLETCYPALKSILPGVSESKWVELLSQNAARIFGISRAGIAIDQPAVLTCYLPGGSLDVADASLFSKSKNSPFIGKQLVGKVMGIINGNDTNIN